MGAANSQDALVAIDVILADRVDAVDRRERDARLARDLLADLGQTDEALAATHEQFGAEFVLEFLQMLRHRGLDDEHFVGRLADAESAIDQLEQRLQLSEFHRA